MISIEVEDKALDLGKTTIQIKLRNDIIGINPLEGDFAYSFRIPDNPHNTAILGYPTHERVGINYKQDKTCSIFLSGIIYRQGVLKVKKAGAGTIHCYIKFHIADVAEKLQSTTLREIDTLPRFDPEQLRPYVEMSLLDVDDLQVKFISTDYKQLHLANQNTYHTLTFANTWDAVSTTSLQQALKSIADDINALDLPIYAEANLTSYTVRITHTMYNDGGQDNEFDTTFMANQPGWDLLDSRVTSDGYNNELAKFMKATLDDENRNFLFPPFKNYKNYAGEDGAVYFNLYFNGSYINPVKPLASMAPWIRLTFLLRQIIAYAGYTLIGDALNNELIRNIYVPNITAANEARFLSQVVQYDFGAPFYLDLKNHVPDTTVAELLKALRNHFGLVFRGGAYANQIEAVLLKDVLVNNEPLLVKTAPNPVMEEDKQTQGYSITGSFDNDELVGQWLYNTEDIEVIETYDTVTAMNAADVEVRAGDVIHIRERSQLYKVTNVNPFTTEFIGHLVDSYQDGEYELEAIANQTYIGTDEDTDRLRFWKIPQFKLEIGAVAKTDTYYSGADSMGLRFLIYQGMQQDSSGNTYPLCSNDDTNYFGLQTQLPYELYFHGQKGLVANFLSEWYRYAQVAKKATVVTQFTELDLVNSFKAIRYTNGKYNFTLSEATLSFTNNQLKPAKCTIRIY